MESVYRMSVVLETASRLQQRIFDTPGLTMRSKQRTALLDAIIEDYQTIKRGDEPVAVINIDAELNGKRQSATDFE